MEQTVMVVDEMELSRGPIARDLEGAGFQVIETSNAVEGWRAFKRRAPDLVMSAARPPGSGGIDLLRRIREVSDVPVILFSEAGDVATAIAAFRCGAHDFLTFPGDRERLLEDAVALSRVASAEGSHADEDWRIAGVSVIAQRLRDRVRALAPLDVPVLVAGESGSGRDHVVRCLHAQSTKASVALTKISSQSPIALRRPSLDAVVFLDEIGNFTSAEQEHWFECIGGTENESKGRCARIYASISEDLDLMVREGRFHPGLARCLGRFEVRIAPIRERREDIAPVARDLAGRLGRSMGRSRIRFERPALTLLRGAPWVGNVRELRNVVEKLVAFSLDGTITRRGVRDVLGEAPDSVASLRQRRSERQRDELVNLLEACGGNLAEVARRLEISRGAVIYRAQKYGLLPRSRCGRAVRRKSCVRRGRGAK